MRNSFCIFFLLWVTLDVFSGEKCLFTIGSDFIVTDTISKNLSDTSRIFNLSDVVVKGLNIITKSDRLILIPTSNMQKASSSAWDLLSKIKLPGVIVDRQNKNATTINGSNILFKINNIDATIADFLTIIPSDVKKIEFFDKLGARYNDSNISAIINIVTKRLDYIEHDNPTTIFVIYQDQRNFDERKKVVKSLRKHAKWYEMEKLTFDQLYKATREAIIHRNAAIEDNALALLLDRCGNDLLAISNQVEKLCLYTRNIKKEDVERLVPPRVEEDVFKLTNALMNHDLRNIMRVYQDLISKKHDPLELIGLIANSLRNLYQVSIMSKKGYRDNDITSTLGLNPRAIYPIRKNAAHFDITELMEKLYALSELDYAIKTGSVDKYRGLELFLMRI